MKIKRRIRGNKIEEFDRKGRLIYEEDQLGCILRTYKKYDDNDNIIYNKLEIEDVDDNSIHEDFYKYDKRGNEIYYENRLNGKPTTKLWKEYDERNNLIYVKNEDGEESFYKYNDSNKCIYLKEPIWGEVHILYDDNGNEITGWDECIYYEENEEA